MLSLLSIVIGFLLEKDKSYHELELPSEPAGGVRKAEETTDTISIVIIIRLRLLLESRSGVCIFCFPLQCFGACGLLSTYREIFQLLL